MLILLPGVCLYIYVADNFILSSDITQVLVGGFVWFLFYFVFLVSFHLKCSKYRFRAPPVSPKSGSSRAAPDATGRRDGKVLSSKRQPCQPKLTPSLFFSRVIAREEEARG